MDHQEDPDASIVLPSGQQQAMSSHEPPPPYSPEPEAISHDNSTGAQVGCKHRTKSKVNICININIQVVGSRGDIQPFVALGVALKHDGHRVRLSTHAQFSNAVTSSGLEFFDIGGDPADLMAFMAESPSIIPSMKQIRAGVIQKKRAMFIEMLGGLWRSCIEADKESHVPFVADAIIANPPSFAHVHCAQALGVPVHLMFTMPWSSTKAFPHPLASISTSKIDWKTANDASYAAVEMLTWQGLGDIVNDWRKNKLGLEPVPGTEGHRLLEALEVPFTYCWSPSLVAKPEDWGDHIDVCGFFFREPPVYTPTPDLEEFLQAGPPPVYIGFGSIVISGGEGLLVTVLSAVREVGVRAVVGQGWSNLAGESTGDVFFLGDCPHEWLFPKVAAVVHHGGAGTTACGLRFGRPTAIIPFFGDQPFWGKVIAMTGAGPEPIPYRSLTSSGLAQAIEFCLTTKAGEAAERIAHSMRAEDGVTAAVQSFYKHLPLEKMKCDFFPDQTAALVCGRGKKAVRMCKPVASVLVKNERLEMKQLSPYRSNPLVIENVRWDPFTAVSAAAISTLLTMVTDTIDIVVKPVQAHRRRYDERHQPKEDVAAEPDLDKLESKIVEDPIRPPPSFAMLPMGDATQTGWLQKLLGRVSNHRTASTEPHERTAASVVGGVGKLAGNTTKGILVDLPLALTEGLRAVPRLYDSPVRKQSGVYDLRSGLSVAGKTFCEGMSDSVTDIFSNTYHGKMEEGAAGAAKGMAKGTASLLANFTSSTFGLFSYPAQGIYRSIWTKTHESPLQQMLAAKIVEGDWVVSEDERWSRDSGVILQDFNGLMASRS